MDRMESVEKDAEIFRAEFGRGVVWSNLFGWGLLLPYEQHQNGMKFMEYTTNAWYFELLKMSFAYLQL